jgi:hypothetical protein
MVVWIVMPCEYDDYSISAVFGSLEAARAAYPGEWWAWNRHPGRGRKAGWVGFDLDWAKAHPDEGWTRRRMDLSEYEQPPIVTIEPMVVRD